MERHFYHATIGVNFRFPVGKKPEVLVVNYINEEGQIETRFPSGTVQFIDIIKAIEWYIEEMGISDSRNSILWLPMQILDIENKFKNKLTFCKDRNEKNILLGSCLQEVQEKLFSCGIENENLNIIFAKTRTLTLEREVREETDACHFGQWLLASESIVGNHQRLCYTSIETEAPDLYKGSGDADIESSYWMPVENLECKISKKHLNYFLVSIKKVIEIYSNRGDGVLQLTQFVTATNH